MSFASKNSLNFVASAVQYRRPLNMLININAQENTIRMYGENELYTTINFDFKDMEGEWVQNATFWNIQGIQIFAVKEPGGRFVGYYQAGSSTNSGTVIMNFILKQLLTVFSDCTVKTLHVRLENLTPNFTVSSAVSSLRTAENVIIEGEDTRKEINKIIANTEITRSYLSDSKVFKGGYFVHKLRCTDAIEIINATWMHQISLLSFNCSSVILGKTSFTKQDLIAFLQKWRSVTDGSMDRIRNMEIGCPRGVLPLTLSRIAMPYDRNRRPQWFGTLDCASGIDIMNAHNRIATVVHKWNKFYFIVWD